MRHPAKVYMLAVCASAGGLLFGYDTGVVSGAMLLVKDDFHLSSFQQELVVSLTVGGAIIGSLAGTPLSDRLGRKPTTMIASAFYIVGALLMSLAPGWPVLASGRLVVGVGVGLASMVVPMYIAEVAPCEIRGTLTTINNLSITFGQCLAGLVDGAFSGTRRTGWRYMFGLSALPAVVQLVGFFFLPDSPRWLISRGRPVEAKTVLRALRAADADVDGEMADILRAAEPQQGFRALIATPALRRTLLVGVGLQVINQLVGINTVMYYSGSILKTAGITSTALAIWLAAAIAGVNALFTVVAMLLVEKGGRRFLMLWSLVGCVLGLQLLAAAFYLGDAHSPATQPSNSTLADCAAASCRGCLARDCGFCRDTALCLPANTSAATCPDHEWYSSDSRAIADICPDSYAWLALLALCVYIASFASGVGAIPWVVNSEIYPAPVRSAGNSASVATNWICALAISLTFLTLTEEITRAGAFWLYSAFAALGLAFVYTYMPETKGKTLEQITGDFEAKSSGKGASSYTRLN